MPPKRPARRPSWSMVRSNRCPKKRRKRYRKPSPNPQSPRSHPNVPYNETKATRHARIRIVFLILTFRARDEGPTPRALRRATRLILIYRPSSRADDFVASRGDRIALNLVARYANNPGGFAREIYRDFSNQFPIVGASGGNHFCFLTGRAATLARFFASGVYSPSESSLRRARS